MNISNSTEPVKQLRPWRKTRAALLTLGALATLLAIVYSVENIRGRRAWENCKRELEGRGVRVDWAAYVPDPVPDDQNVFKAPNMTQWFMLSNALGRQDKGWRGVSTPLKDIRSDRFAGPIAEVTVMRPGETVSTNGTDAVLRYGDSASAEIARTLMRTKMGATLMGVRGDFLVTRSPETTRPARIIVEAPTQFGEKEVTAFLLSQMLVSSNNFSTTPSGSNTFGISVKGPIYEAKEYLAATDQLAGEFNEMREALKRPLMRMDGNYEPPVGPPYINFLSMRTAAQTLGMRAQCLLLLGKPEEALQELTLIHDLCRLLDARPVTLVAAMINVAITGLYVEVVREGLALGVWKESQLVAIQKQLAEINLPREASAAFNAEMAFTSRTLETLNAKDLAGLFDAPHSTKGFWDRAMDGRFWFFALAPRGWIHQNLATGALLTPRLVECIDATNKVVQPRRIEEAHRAIASLGDHFSPYSVLIAIMTPNYVRACVSLARNQALVNEALIACALERYRLEHHEYPENLEALAPKFLDNIPRDVIGGGNLKYRRNQSGGFLLYSIGWNEKDDGGIENQSKMDGDWVWDREWM